MKMIEQLLKNDGFTRKFEITLCNHFTQAISLGQTLCTIDCMNLEHAL